MTHLDFRQFIWDFYKKNKRIFPWRETTDPYHILVSELMLQQTQTYRVLPKYLDWLEKFTTIEILSKASLADVLIAWSGLGYNRRAKFLHRAAIEITQNNNGIFPPEENDLKKLSGVGDYTAKAVLTFAYNKPQVFVETNIRTVYIHHFFQDSDLVSDLMIKEKIAETLPENDFRNWYYALMDYGSFLKSSGVNYFKKIKGHNPQSRFRGSKRFVRGWILKELAKQRSEGNTVGIEFPLVIPGYEEPTILEIIEGLIHEGMIIKIGKYLQLP